MTTLDAGDTPSLKGGAAKGALWTLGQSIVVRGLSLVGFVVLARLLTPHDYGLAALANVFVLLLLIVAAAGLGAALVQRPQVDETDLDTVFWIGLGLGAALALLQAGAAWPLARAFDEPELRPILQVLAVAYVFVGLGGVHQAILRRRMAFGSITRVTVVANVVATAVGVSIALLGAGVWALVTQTLLATCMTYGGWALVSGYRPGRRVSSARLRGFLGFSRNSMGSSLMTFLSQRADDFLIASVLGSTALGVYAVAYRLLSILVEVLITGARTVAFPAFSRMQDDPERLTRGFLAATRMTALLAFPVFAFAAIAAPELVPVVFGDQWQESVTVMQILSVYGPAEIVIQFNAVLLLSVGSAHVAFRLTALYTAVQVAGFALTVGYGIEWVAAGYVVCGYALAPIGITLATRRLTTGFAGYVANTLPALASALVMVVAMVGTRTLLEPVATDPVVLVALAATGAGAYLLAIRLIGPTQLREAWGFGRLALTRGRVDVELA